MNTIEKLSQKSGLKIDLHHALVMLIVDFRIQH